MCLGGDLGEEQAFCAYLGGIQVETTLLIPVTGMWDRRGGGVIGHAPLSPGSRLPHSVTASPSCCVAAEQRHRPRYTLTVTIALCNCLRLPCRGHMALVLQQEQHATAPGSHAAAGWAFMRHTAPAFRQASLQGPITPAVSLATLGTYRPQPCRPALSPVAVT